MIYFLPRTRESDDAVREFVENGLWGGRRQLSQSVCVGYACTHDGIIAGFAYHNYDPDTRVVEVSGYSSRRRWATRRAVKRICWDMPFVTLSCRVMVARMSEHNRVARRIMRSLGAEEYVIPELRGYREGEAIAVLRRDVFEASDYMKEGDDGNARADTSSVVDCSGRSSSPVRSMVVDKSRVA